MSKLFMQTLGQFGFRGIALSGPIPDPTNEQELFAIDFSTANPVTWEAYITKYNEIKYKEELRLLRNKRNQLLKDTDWLLTLDVAPTIANIDEIKAYRQALRDLPNSITIVWNNNNNLDFDKMNMPTMPTIQKIQLTPETTQ